MKHQRAIAVMLLGSAVATVVACSGASSEDVQQPGTSGGMARDDASTTSSGDSATPGPGDSSTHPLDGAAPPDGATRVFTLTSAVITEGGTFPAASTCTGANTSPPLAWSGAPATTKSYAIILHDVTNNLLHAGIYDIPSAVTMLAADYPAAYAPATPAGAHETKNYKGAFGYAGPCPPVEHTYELVLYALDVATLPGVTMSTSLADVVAALVAHSVGSAKLTAKYKQP